MPAAPHAVKSTRSSTPDFACRRNPPSSTQRATAAFRSTTRKISEKWDDFSPQEKQRGHGDRRQKDHHLKRAQSSNRVGHPSRENAAAGISKRRHDERIGRNRRAQTCRPRERHELTDGHLPCRRSERKRNPEQVNVRVLSICPLQSRRVWHAHRFGVQFAAVSGGRILQQCGADHRHDQEDTAENLESRSPAERRNQLLVSECSKIACPPP